MSYLQEPGRLKWQIAVADVQVKQQSGRDHSHLWPIASLHSSPAFQPMGWSQPIQNVSPVEFAVPCPVLRGPEASCSVVAVGLIQELWQRQPSLLYCQISLHLRRAVFPCALRTGRLLTVGYVTCAAKMINGIAYGSSASMLAAHGKT